MPKSDKAVEVSSNNYGLAKQRWDEYWAIENEGRPYQSFHSFLGMHSAPYRKVKFNKEHTVMIRGSAARKVQLLCGPYYNAILAKIRITKLP